MKLITTTQELRKYCKYAASFDYVTIDTEFLREKTYYSKLCLVQLAVQHDSTEASVVVDVLSTDIDLEILHDLLMNPLITKVFHAARQDLEIFYHLFGSLPAPIFDTQIAAMVCGFGEQIGYDNLVKNITGISIDKSSRFTDWSRRPLSKEQLDYAIGDVTFLRGVYEYLNNKLNENMRSSWVNEEMEILTSSKTYTLNPDEAWKRVKIRTNSGEFIAILREVTSFREIYAQSKNIPRNRVLRDETIIELCSIKPQSIGDLKKLRLFNSDNRSKDLSEGILVAIKKGLNCSPEDYPKIDRDRKNINKNSALSEMLRVLLKASTDRFGVAQKLVATTAELDKIASGEKVEKIFQGWRLDVFGRDALRLCDGKIGLTVKNNQVVVFDVK